MIRYNKIWYELMWYDEIRSDVIRYDVMWSGSHAGQNVNPLLNCTVL